MSILLYALRIPPILMALSFHEFAHGYVARSLGDRTAEMEGRLTLNPLKHLDPLGTIMLFFGPFGWAKPVPVNPMNLRDPIKDMMPIAAAGPAMNIVLAVVSALFIKLGLMLNGMNMEPGLISRFFLYYLLVFYISLRINIGLAIFNLIPVYPLDGSRILMGIIPRAKAMKLIQYGQYFTIIFIVLVVTGKLGFIIIPINWLQGVITNVFAIPYSIW